MYLEHVEHLCHQKLFSKAGEVVAARRSNIQPRNVDMILFLNKHLLCFGIVQWYVEFFLFVWGRGQYHMVWYQYTLLMLGIAHC